MADFWYCRPHSIYVVCASSSLAAPLLPQTMSTRLSGNRWIIVGWLLFQASEALQASYIYPSGRPTPTVPIQPQPTSWRHLWGACPASWKFGALRSGIVDANRLIRFLDRFVWAVLLFAPARGFGLCRVDLSLWSGIFLAPLSLWFGVKDYPLP